MSDTLANTFWKQLSLGIVCFVVIMGGVILACAFKHQSYKPIKAKQLKIILFAYLINICFMIGALQSLRIIDQTGHTV
jgi:hypothetical protein